MKAVLLLAVALALSAVVVTPTASAVCSGDTFVDEDCRAALCTLKKPTGPWIHTCWGIVGPPI